MKFAGWDKHGIDWKRIVEFCRTNIRYISSGVVVVILVVVLAVTAEGQGKGQDTDTSKQENGQESEQNQGQEQDTENQIETTTFSVDAIPEINTLIQSYYGAYADGDTAALETYATPISDLEKKYIAVMSQYVAGYENLTCYTEEGISQGEYAVMAIADTRFEGVETTAASLEFFYVRQNESGSYYIDNLYSTFNTANQELEQDSQIAALITEYEQREDVIKLVEDVQAKYTEDLNSDENLKTMAEVTIPEALKAWVAQVVAEADGTTTGETADTTDPAQTTGETTDPAQTTDETTDTAQTTEPADSGQSTSTSETVYTTSNVNIRREPSETAEQVGSAVAGQSFTRTANTDGWSQIEYNGGTAYIKSDYLSTEAPAESTGTGVNWVNPGTELTLSRALNVRKSMSETSELMGTAQMGEKVTVVLSYAEGWTKVEWNGKTGYILTELLLNN